MITTSAPSTRTPVQTVPLRGINPIEQEAQSVSMNWGGQTQMAFRSLVREWSAKYPDQAKKLVFGPYMGAILTLSDESKLALSMVLKSAKTDAEASSALNSLVDPWNTSALLGVDATTPIWQGRVEPKYNLSDKALYLRKHTGLTD